MAKVGDEVLALLLRFFEVVQPALERGITLIEIVGNRVGQSADLLEWIKGFLSMDAERRAAALQSILEGEQEHAQLLKRLVELSEDEEPQMDPFTAEFMRLAMGDDKGRPLPFDHPLGLPAQ